jgi:hypothetical protein
MREVAPTLDPDWQDLEFIRKRTRNHDLRRAGLEASYSNGMQ